ncbi:MAG: CARDB domain-containing protein [Oscillospiraceae bacterium]
MRRIAALISCAVIALAAFAPAVMAGTTPPPPAAPPTAPTFMMDGNAPKYELGESIGGFNITVQDIHIDPPATPTAVNNVRIELLTSSDLTKYPFEIVQQTYMSPVIAAVGKTYTYKVPSLRVRGDATVGYYDLPIKVYYDFGTVPSSEDLTFRVFVGPSANQHQASADTHIPKVIISGFTTNPTPVVAGEDFVLNVTFKNTSASGSVSNMKAALSSSDSTFNPVSGSSTLFIEGLAPGATKSMTIKLHAKADAAPGSYNASFALNYDTSVPTKDNAPVTDTEVVAIPVKQVPKVQVSKMQVTPSEIFAGNDINIMTSVNNTGKATVYNVNVKVTDTKNLFSLGEQYLGNLLSGASGAVDLYVTPKTVGSTSLQLNITYEDENGNSFNNTQTYDATIGEKGLSGGDMGGVMPGGDIIPEKTGGIGWWIWIVLAVIVAAIVIAVLLKRKRTKARTQRDRLEAKRLEEEYLNTQFDPREDTRV